MTAHPRPASPFNWTVFVSGATTHRFTHVNLVRKQPRQVQPDDGFIARLDAAYLPVAQATWEQRTRYGGHDVDALARAAWHSDALGFFRWFADVPAFDGVTAGSTCVWFVDLRFLTPGREQMPFQFGACRDAPGAAWRAYQRDGDAMRVPVS